MRIAITGASRGIGAGIARACHHAGHRVGLLARSDEQLDALARELPGAAWHHADVAEGDGLRDAVDAVAGELAGLEGMVVNAGLSIRRPLSELDPADWRRMVDVNIHGAYHSVQAALPHLRRAGGGHLIFISSISGRLPLSGGAGYAACKYAVTGLAESLFMELRDEGIKVATIFPGSVATKLHEDAEGVDHGMMVQPQEVGEAVVHILAQPGNTCVNRLEIRPLRKPSAG